MSELIKRSLLALLDQPVTYKDYSDNIRMSGILKMRDGEFWVVNDENLTEKNIRFNGVLNISSSFGELVSHMITLHEKKYDRD